MSRRLLDEHALGRALRALADDEARVETPARVEAAVMAGWDAHVKAAQASPSAHTRTRGLVRGAATIATGVTIVGAVALERELPITTIVPPQPPVISFGGPERAPLEPAIASTTDAPSASAALQRRRPVTNEARSTLVLVGGPIATGEIVHMVRMRVARSALTELGI